MSYGNSLCPVGQLLSCADVVDSMKNVGAIVSVSTAIADSDGYIFQDDKTVFALERLPLDSPRLHRAFAIFTAISVHNPISQFIQRICKPSRSDTGRRYEAPHYASHCRAVRRRSLDQVFVPSWIIPLDLDNTTRQNRMLNVDDAQIVLSHLFGRMGGHVVLSKPDHFPDTFDPRSPIRLPSPHPVAEVREG
jgi:hypothetical protein